MRRTRVRRGASPRRGRPARARGRGMIRHQSARRRRYGQRARASQLSLGKALAAAVVIALVAVVAVLAVTSYRVDRLRPVPGSPIAPVAQFVYTARTANDATITLPGMVTNELLQTGLAHRAIALTRVGFTGKVSTSQIDMTPRTGNSSTDRVLKVPGRAVPVINAKISAIEKAINSTTTTTGGGRALYAGLTRTDFTSVPVTIISSGLDLANPDDFRSLKWDVSPKEVAATVQKSGALPTLHGPVTFIIVPTAGPRSSSSDRPRRST